MDVSPSGGGTLFLTNESRDVVVDQPTRYPTSYDCFFISDRANVRANANSGYKFDRWIIDPQPSGFNTRANPVEFVNNEPRRLTAIFVSGSTTPTPSAPTGITASDGTYNNRIYVSWNPSSGATSYDVYRSTSSSGLKPLAGTTTSTNYTDTNISCDGTRYYYWVTARNSSGSSSMSTSYDSGYCDDDGGGTNPPPPVGGVSALTAAQAKAEIDTSLGLVIFDVREKSEYDIGHLLCAQWAVWNTFTIGFVNYDKTKDYSGLDILIYDQDGANAVDAANYLAKEGFSTVYYITGGINAWETAGYEIVDSTNPCSIPPMADAGEDQTVSENTTVSLDGSGSASSSGTLSYVWTQPTEQTDVVLLNPKTATPTFTAPYVQEGGRELIFYLKVINSQGVADTDSVSVFVNWLVSNNNPVASAVATPANVNEGSGVMLSASASTDPDNDIETYAWTQISGSPTVSLSGANSPVATFSAPPVSAQTTLTFQVTVTDEQGNFDTDTVSVVIQNVDTNDPDAPDADAGDDASVNESATVMLDGSGSVAPGGIITGYQWVQISGTTVSLRNGNTVSPSFTAPSIDTDQELLTFQLVVTSNAGKKSTPDEVVIIVKNVLGIRPVAFAGIPQIVYAGSTITLDGSKSMDADGSIETYQWQQVSGPTVTLSDANSQSAAFVAPPDLENTEMLEFELTVTDNDGLSGSDQVTIVVDITPPPVADAGSDQIVKEKNQVILDGSASKDMDGNSVQSYSWKQTSGTPVALSGTSTAQAEFSAPDISGNLEVLIFELTVEGLSGLRSSDLTAITVKKKSSSSSGCFISAME